MATREEIVSFLQANPNLSDREIVAAMNQYGVSTQQLASATGAPTADVQRRYELAQLGVEPTLPGGTPARPTFSGVAAEWNELARDRFGTYLNLFGREDDPAVARQIQELQATTKQAQEAWDALYGDTPEGKIVKENPPPDWRDTYEPWLKEHTDVFGAKYMNRPWSSDANAINQKAELDRDYLKALEDYNKKHGTNLAPDPAVLGSMVQPSEFYKAPEKEKWYKNPVKAGLALAAIAAGGYYLLGPGSAAGAAGGATGGAAGGAAAGAAGGTGLTVGAGGATGLTAGTAGAGFAAPAGFTFAPGVGTSLAAGGLGTTSLLDGAVTSRIGETGLLADTAGVGLQVPTTPGISAMGGAQGLTVPGVGGTVSALGLVPAGATPILGSPSFFINDANVLGRPVFSTDTLTLPGQTTGVDWKQISDIARGANTISNLLGGDQQQQQQAIGGAALQAFPFQEIYGPLQAGLLPTAQQFRRPSLLG